MNKQLRKELSAQLMGGASNTSTGKPAKSRKSCVIRRHLKNCKAKGTLLADCPTFLGRASCYCCRWVIQLPRQRWKNQGGGPCCPQGPLSPGGHLWCASSLRAFQAFLPIAFAAFMSDYIIRRKPSCSLPSPRALDVTFHQQFSTDARSKFLL